MSYIEKERLGSFTPHHNDEKASLSPYIIIIYSIIP